MKIRRGMRYSAGDIVLVKFPFTDLKNSKKRPVLVVKSQSELDDIICFQITSSSRQDNLLKIENDDFVNLPLPLASFVKYDKCFTINSEIVEKKIAKVDLNFLEKLKSLFCNELFL